MAAKLTFQPTDEAFLELCRKYSLTPRLLMTILYYKIIGKNNADIAKEIGVHRVTIQRYLEVMRSMHDTEVKKVVNAISKTINRGV